MATVFAFTYGLLCPFGLSFGHSRPVFFLWVSSAHLLIPHSHGLFTNFIGLSWPSNLILILGGLWACHKPLTFLVYITLGLLRPFLAFLPHTLPMGCYFFLSFRASLSPLVSSRPICLFLGPMIHYSCRLGLMVFCYQFFNSLLPLLLGFLSFCLGSHKWPSTPGKLFPFNKNFVS